MHEPDLTGTVVQFTLLLALVLLAQVGVERLRIPSLVGLIAVGVLFGPGGYGVLPREPVVELFGTIGLVYIMFLAGLEIDLDAVREHPRPAGTLGALAFTLTFVPVAGVGLALGYGLAGAVLLGAALASHTLISYPMLARRGLVHSKPVVAAVGGTLLTDTLALVVLVVVVDLAAGDGGVLGWLQPVLLLAALAALSLWLLPHGARFFFDRIGMDRAENALFALVVLLLVALAADWIGTEKILGAFLAGLCLNRAVRHQRELGEHLRFVGRMLFVPFFFVETGMRLEFEVLTGGGDVWLLAGALVGVVLIGKGAAAWLAGRRYGWPGPARVLVLGLTVPQAAATLAVVVIGAESGILDDAVVDAVIVVILVTCIGGPLLAGWGARRIERDEA